jgi:hypothetical protein
MICPREKNPVSIKYEDGLAPELFWRRKKFLSPPEFETRTVHFLAIRNTDCAISALQRALE